MCSRLLSASMSCPRACSQASDIARQDSDLRPTSTQLCVEVEACLCEQSGGASTSEWMTAWTAPRIEVETPLHERVRRSAIGDRATVHLRYRERRDTDAVTTSSLVGVGSVWMTATWDWEFGMNKTLESKGYVPLLQWSHMSLCPLGTTVKVCTHAHARGHKLATRVFTACYHL